MSTQRTPVHCSSCEQRFSNPGPGDGKALAAGWVRTYSRGVSRFECPRCHQERVEALAKSGRQG